MPDLEALWEKVAPLHWEDDGFPTKCPKCGCRDLRPDTYQDSQDEVDEDDPDYIDDGLDIEGATKYTCFHCHHTGLSANAQLEHDVLACPQLLHPMKGALGLFLPVGPLKEGGTCEFATKTCKAKCYVKHQKHPSDEVKRATLQAIKQYKVNTLVARLDLESRMLPDLPLHFFATGDCPSYLTSKMGRVITGISFFRASKCCGFTRNRALWEEVSSMSGWYLPAGFFLTIENKEKANHYKYGKFAIPDYDTRRVHLWHKQAEYWRSSGGCSSDYKVPGFFKEITEEVGTGGCEECRRLAVGCFEKELEARHG